MIDLKKLGTQAGRVVRAAHTAATAPVATEAEPDARPTFQAQASGLALIDDLVLANRILYARGVLDSFGHVSVRHPEERGHFFMARSMGPGQVTAADILEFDADANALDQRERAIYSERYIHSEIYRVRPDVAAVVHSHSPGVIPFGVTPVPLQPISVTAPFLFTGVPIYDPRDAGESEMLVRNPALGRTLAMLLADHAVALMRGHGNVVVGPTLRVAVTRAVYTEVNARLQTQAVILAAGAPINFLSTQEAARLEEMAAREVAGTGRGADRAWEMWRAELGAGHGDHDHEH